jgi:response regulator RpfG family c-di-GMP phosphodiesterase
LFKPEACPADHRTVGTTGATRDVGVLGASSDELIRLREVAQSPSVERALDAVREFLDMDVAFVGRITAGEQVFDVLRGDGTSFGLSEGGAVPLDQTYCQRILSGRLPNLIPDTHGDDRAASVAATEEAGIGAYASVPLRFSDGRLHGMLCAASHAPKPSLGYRELQFLHVFARMVADVLERESLEKTARGLELRAATAQALIAAVQARDAYTAQHSRDVVDHALAVARKLGLSEEEVREIGHVAMLHDIGKIAVPDTILGKPGSLTDDEWKVMRSHSARGEQMVSNTPGLEHLAQAIRAEHERWDGQGYPDGLAGEKIPLASRITFVCDAYHAMTSDRPYRPALSPDAARAEIEAGIGGQFCPRSAQAFLEVLDEPSED